jgi:UDP-glucose 4-epimerase
MRSFLVTGGCGFIGSHLADALVGAGHRVRILDDFSTGKRSNAPAEAEIVTGDVADAATVRAAMAGMDGCYHLAAVASVQRSVEAWEETHRVNLGGSINVFEAAHAAGGIPVVYASSAAVYGDHPEMPLREDAPLLPIAPYGADKAGSELHARAALAVRGVPSTGMRFFNVFGPRQDPASPYSGVISIFAERLLAGKPMTVYGDGRQTRDFIFVADIVAALQAAMGRQDRSAKVFNVCRGEEVTLLRLIAALERAAGRKAIVVHAEARPGDARRSVGDPSRLAAGLGFAAKIGLEEGLAALLRWLESSRTVSAASV